MPRRTDGSRAIFPNDYRPGLAWSPVRVPIRGRTDARFLFNATAGSIMLTPSEFVLEARPGTLRLVRPSVGAQGLYLLLMLVVAFGYIGLFILVAGSETYQNARPWENPTFLPGFLILFLIGFFASLFGAEVLGRRFSVWRAARGSNPADAITLRGLVEGRMIQKLLVQTADARILVIEVEARGRRFREALGLAGVRLPLPPFSADEAAAVEAIRLRALREAPGPTGAGRPNVSGFLFVAAVGIPFLSLFVGMLVIGEILTGILGLSMFVPIVVYLARVFTHTRRFSCGVCGRETVFRGVGGTWTCARCGGSWPRPM